MSERKGSLFQGAVTVNTLLAEELPGIVGRRFSTSLTDALSFVLTAMPNFTPGEYGNSKI
jgi:hypothetical protein